MNIAHLLTEHARHRPDAAAIIDTHRGRDRVTTFRGLDEQAARAAALLESHGLRPGDAVLVLQPMGAELYAALVALFRLRLTAMFLDPSAGRDHIERCCALHPPRGFIGSAKAHLLRLWCPSLRRIPVRFAVGGWWVPGATAWRRADALPPHGAILDGPDETPALLTFTSGSTGAPKAAVRSHGFLLAQHRALSRTLGLAPGGVDVATMPVVLLANLASGVTSLIPDADLRYPGRVEPAPVVAQIQRHGATSAVASPAFFERLTRHCHDNGVTLPGLRRLYTGGAPVFPRLLRAMRVTAPNAEAVALYGSTEAEPIADVAWRDVAPDDQDAMLRGRGLLAGRPVDEVTLRILRDRWGTPVGPFAEGAFDKECCPAGEPGEVVVTGDHVLKGYLHGHGDAETKFRAGGVTWHRTGDAGYLDDAGRLWLLGRCAATIRDARGEVYPFAAETAVSQDPAVKRAAFVAHAGRRTLAVEAYPGARLDVDALREALAWAGVEEVRVLAEVPVDPRHNAKVDYPALAKRLDASHG